MCYRGMANREDAPGSPGWDDSLHKNDGRVTTAGAGYRASQFSANELGNKRIRESQATEPQLFTHTLKPIAPANSELPSPVLLFRAWTANTQRRGVSR